MKTKDMGMLYIAKLFLAVFLVAGIINLAFFGHILDAEGWAIGLLCLSIYLILTRKKGKIAFILFGLWALIETIARVFLDLFRVFPSYDILSHFLSFSAITAFLILVYDKKFKFIIFFAFLASIAFELGEKLHELIVPQAVWFQDCLFCRDGLTDILINLSAVVIVYLIIKVVKNDRTSARKA